MDCEYKKCKREREQGEKGKMEIGKGKASMKNGKQEREQWEKVNNGTYIKGEGV